jgi:hypothetical protein
MSIRQPPTTLLFQSIHNVKEHQGQSPKTTAARNRETAKTT